jgi:hypothetical protein
LKKNDSHQSLNVLKELYGGPTVEPEELVERLTATPGPCAIVLCKGKFMEVVWSSKASDLSFPDERRKLVENFQYLLDIAGVEAKELVEYEEDDSLLSTPSSCEPAHNQEVDPREESVGSVAPSPNQEISCWSMDLWQNTLNKGLRLETNGTFTLSTHRQANAVVH